MPGLLQSKSALHKTAKQAEEETVEPNREPFKTRLAPYATLFWSLRSRECRQVKT